MSFYTLHRESYGDNGEIGKRRVLTGHLCPVGRRKIIVKDPCNPIDEGTLSGAPRPNQEKGYGVGDFVVAGRRAADLFDPVSGLMPNGDQNQPTN